MWFMRRARVYYVFMVHYQLSYQIGKSAINLRIPLLGILYLPALRPCLSVVVSMCVR